MRFFLDYVSGRLFSNAATLNIVVAFLSLNFVFKLPDLVRGVYELPVFSGSVAEQTRQATFARKRAVYEKEIRELRTLTEDLYAYRNWLEKLKPELNAYRYGRELDAYRYRRPLAAYRYSLGGPVLGSTMPDLTIPQPQLPIQDSEFVLTKYNMQILRFQTILYRFYRGHITEILRPFLVAADVQKVDTNSLRVPNSTPFTRMLSCLDQRHRGSRRPRRVFDLIFEDRRFRQWIVNVRGSVQEFNQLWIMLDALSELPPMPDESLLLLFTRVSAATPRFPETVTADQPLWGVARYNLAAIYDIVRTRDAQAELDLLNIARNNR